MDILTGNRPANSEGNPSVRKRMAGCLSLCKRETGFRETI